ncbi:MAG TPA: EamA family transporter [Hyphomicrobiaceae bacterium]|nr:EamA family transporter [Hyphomicrobiaceae bacterium]
MDRAMTVIATPPQRWSAGAGVLAVLIALACQNLGAAIAKTLFGQVGAEGVAALRIGLAACLLVAWRRPWRCGLQRGDLGILALYGAVLGAMNLVIYLAFARIPIGIAVGIEVTGPLAVALLGSRRPLDFLWLAAAVAGLLLLLPVKSSAPLDPLGVLLAACSAVCWALYIVLGKRLSAGLGADAVAWGMVIAALIVAPIGAARAGMALLGPGILGAGLGIALLSSALPYSLEMAALRRVPAHVFGILVSSAPAVAALAGFMALGERLPPLQWLAIGCIMLAMAGSGWGARRVQ